MEAAGGEMANMLPYKFVTTQIPLAVALKSTEVYEDILNADVLINVPIAKQHSAAGLTLGMKNMMGVVQNREAMHMNLHQSIADLNSLIKPHLTVLDAVTDPDSQWSNWRQAWRTCKNGTPLSPARM